MQGEEEGEEEQAGKAELGQSCRIHQAGAWGVATPVEVTVCDTVDVLQLLEEPKDLVLQVAVLLRAAEVGQHVLELVEDLGEGL